MAWQPTKAERDLELILFGAMLVSQDTAKRTLESVGNHAFYNSDVGMLVDRISDALNRGASLKEDVEFSGWCKNNGVTLNGGSVVDSIAAVVKGNGKRRATKRALFFANYEQQSGSSESIERLQAALREIEK